MRTVKGTSPLQTSQVQVYLYKPCLKIRNALTLFYLPLDVVVINFWPII